MTTNRPNRTMRHRLAGRLISLRAGFRTRRSAILAVGASVVTVLALIQVPVCGMNMEACLLMSSGSSNSGGAASAPSDGMGGMEGMAGAACPLAGPNGGMECCAGDATGKAPAEDPKAADHQLQKQPQAQSPDTECVAQCVPCGPDGEPIDAPDGQGAVPEVPLYTLFSSYLS